MFMKQFLWTPDLATGNPTIDSEHQQLIKAINALMEACSKGQGRAVLDKIMRFMYAYTEKHFGHEEELQKHYLYPDYPNHKRYHEGFKKVVRDVCAEIHQEGATIGLLGKVNTQIAGWLATHIKTEDVKVAAHIKKMQEQGVR